MIYISEHKAEQLMELFDVEYEVIESYRNYLGRAEAKNFSARMGRTASSDSTKQKTYDAENKFMRMYGKMGNLVDVEHAQRIALDIHSSPEWVEFGYDKRACVLVPEISFRAMGRHSGIAYHRKISLARGSGTNVYTLLHELAHTAGHRHHDVGFRRCVVAFVNRYDRKLAQLLEKAFKDEGLRMREPKVKEVMPFDKWLKKYNHMKARVRPHHPKLEQIVR